MKNQTHNQILLIVATALVQIVNVLQGKETPAADVPAAPAKPEPAAPAKPEPARKLPKQKPESKPEPKPEPKQEPVVEAEIEVEDYDDAEIEIDIDADEADANEADADEADTKAEAEAEADGADDVEELRGEAKRLVTALVAQDALNGRKVRAILDSYGTRNISGAPDEFIAPLLAKLKQIK